MTNAIHLYREATARSTPAGSTARQRCDICRAIKSRGQFPAGSNVCVRCKPQGVNFRRGGL